MLSFILSVFYALPNMIFMISYVSGANSFQMPLSANEEEMFLKRYALGDKEARNILIERNLRLVAHVVKKYSAADIEMDDLISIGTIGLIKGISTFRSEKGTRLATYAARCIENEILMSLRSNKKRQHEVLLQDPVGKDKDGKEITLIDKLSVSGENVFDEVDTRLQMSSLTQSMKYILTPREKKIIELRYGLADGYPYTQMDVAGMMKISRSYVSRIEKKAIGKLFKKLSEEK